VFLSCRSSSILPARRLSTQMTNSMGTSVIVVAARAPKIEPIPAVSLNPDVLANTGYQLRAHRVIVVARVTGE